MKYSILINQRAVIENNWDLKANHMAVLQVISEWILNPKSLKIQDENGIWVWVSQKIIIKELPMFEIKERRCLDLMRDLSSFLLIEMNPNNQKLGRTYVRIGSNFSKINSNNEGYEPTQNTATLRNLLRTPPQNIANPSAINCEPPPQNIADYNNTNYNNTKDKNTNYNLKANFQKNENFKSENTFQEKKETVKEIQKEKEKNSAKKEKEVFENTLFELGIDSNLISDFVSFRQKKKASLSLVIIKSLCDEAKNANITLSQAIECSIVQNWMGFRASWYQNLTNKNQNGKSNYQSSIAGMPVGEVATAAAAYLKEYPL